jgi:hypothetical protein
MNSWINLTALWKIVVFGLAAGAGLPALFAVGLRALNPRPQAAGSGDGEQARAGVMANPVGLAIAVLCFAVVLSAIGWGIDFIVSQG